MTDPWTASAEPGPPVRIETRRTVVRLAREDEAAAVLRYYSENREHFLPFDPDRPDHFYEERFWRAQLRQNFDHYSMDLALRLFIFPKSDADLVIGNIGFSNVVRGVGQNCTLGYSIDHRFTGQGLMTEALGAAIDLAFDQLRLHRIEANYLPHNRRSGNLLRRLGFVVEGYSRDYLRINGRWEDHIRTALVNPRWNGPGRG